jgi:glutathione S-transferase
MRLYHRWKCPWCAAARQAIENVGVEVELVEVPYPREERVEVAALSGQRRVPVLVDGDQVVVGSRPIVRHLYRRYGGERFAASAAELAADLRALPEERLAEVCALPERSRV